MSAANFVQQLIGNKKVKKDSFDSGYLATNEAWQDSLVRIMLTGILKNQFYRTADEQAKEALPLIVQAAKKDPKFLLKTACFARDAHMKGMVKLGVAALNGVANEKFLNDNNNRYAIVGLLSTFHPGQLLQFVELCKSKSMGRGFGSRAQKWVRTVMENWTSERIDEFTLKYPTALNALVRLVHPRYTDDRGNIVGYVLASGTPISKRQIVVDNLKRKPDPEIIAKEMLKHSIPWDVIKGFAGMNNKDLCMAMMTQMGLSALLLNIRSLEQHGVFGDSNGLTALKMKLSEVKKGRSIPIDFAKPYIYASNQKVKDLLVDAMADCLDVPMDYVENKDIGVSIDISGSMAGEPLITSGLLAVPFLKSKNLWFTTFDTSLYEEGGRTTSRSSYYANSGGACPKLKGQTRKAQVKALLELRTAGGTDVSISISEAIRQRKKLDLMVLVTDEQQNAGSPLRKVWDQYRKLINPAAELWVINATNNHWHSADFNDPSITVYQSLTPAIFKNMRYLGMDLVSTINAYDLNKQITRGAKTVENIEED